MRTQTTLMLCVFMGATMSAACSSPEAKKPDNTALIKETPQPVAKASPQEVDAAIKAADAQLAARDYKGAVELYQRAISMDPTRWEVHHNLAIAHSFIPNFDAAIASINEALKLGGERDARAWFTLGNLYQNRNMYEESIDAYRAGLSLHSSPHVESLLNISAAYIFLHRYDEARATLNHIMTVSPDHPQALHNMALIPHLNQDYKAASDMYTRVHQLAPNYGYAYFNHADALKDWKRCDRAIPMYQRYLELEPQGPYVDKARARLQQCMEERPNKR